MTYTTYKHIGPIDQGPIGHIGPIQAPALPHLSNADASTSFAPSSLHRPSTHTPLRHHNLHAGLFQRCRQLLRRLSVGHQNLHRAQPGNLGKRVFAQLG